MTAGLIRSSLGHTKAWGIWRMSEIVAPNMDPILDPTYAHHEAQRLFVAQFEAARDLREYGRDLIKRLLGTRADNLLDLVLIGGFLRQALVGFDGWLLCAEHGASQAGKVHLRSLFEADLSSEWIVRGDAERLARQVYVANLRANKSWTRRLIPRTNEQQTFAEAWRKRFGGEPPVDADQVRMAREHHVAIQDLLERPLYEHTFRDFEAFVAARHYEPNWYEIGANAVSSVFAMTVALGREAEYMVLYDTYSDATHGSRTDMHFRRTGTGPVMIAPIRQPAELRNDITFAFSLVLSVYQRLLDRYRPDEMDSFRRAFLDRWRDFMQPPKIEVASEPVLLH